MNKDTQTYSGYYNYSLDGVLKSHHFSGKTGSEIDKEVVSLLLRDGCRYHGRIANADTIVPPKTDF